MNTCFFVDCASPAIRRGSPQDQRSASVTGRDPVVRDQVGVDRKGCGSEAQKDEVEHETPRSAMGYEDTMW